MAFLLVIMDSEELECPIDFCLFAICCCEETIKLNVLYLQVEFSKVLSCSLLELHRELIMVNWGAWLVMDCEDVLIIGVY